jgi:hypothetical protein
MAGVFLPADVLAAGPLLFHLEIIQMTEFSQDVTVRHMCRDPRCGCKLPEPVSNSREAFCCRGCHTQFYRTRCLVCEAKMERKTENQLVCGKRKCRNALQADISFGRYPCVVRRDSPPQNINKTGH